MEFDLILEGRILHNGDLTNACIGMKDGKIASIKRTMSGEIKSFGNCILLPGGIDPHVHFRDPGFTHKEDFLSGTTAAAAGGVTCVLDMPNTTPAVTDASVLEEEDMIARKRSVIDYGLFAALTPTTPIIRPPPLLGKAWLLRERWPLTCARQRSPRRNRDWSQAGRRRSPDP